MIVGVRVIVGVNVGIGVIVGVRVMVGVRVIVGVRVTVGVGVTVGEAVGVSVKLSMLPVTMQSPQPGKLKVRLTLQIPFQVELLNLEIHDTCAPPPFIGRLGAVVLIGELIIFVTDGL